MEGGAEVMLRFQERFFSVSGNDSHTDTDSYKPVLRSEKQRALILNFQVGHDNDYENCVHLMNFSLKLEKNDEIFIVVVTYRGL